MLTHPWLAVVQYAICIWLCQRQVLRVYDIYGGKEWKKNYTASADLFSRFLYVWYKKWWYTQSMQNQKISWLTGNIHILLEITMLGMRHTIDSTSIRRNEPFEGGTFSRSPIIDGDFRHNARFYYHFFNTYMNEWSSKMVRSKAVFHQNPSLIQVSTASERNAGRVQVSESLQQSPNLVHCFVELNEKLQTSSSLMKACIHSSYCSCYFDASSSNEFQFDIPDQQVTLIRYL